MGCFGSKGEKGKKGEEDKPDIDPVYQLNGLSRKFVQKSVVGGRVMCANNKRSIRRGKIACMDAKSLYASA